MPDITAAAAACVKVLGQDCHFTVSVTFVSAKKMREINAAHRGADKTTDVLSFPGLDLIKPSGLPLPCIKPAEFPFETDETGAVNLGDIVICKAVAVSQSKEYGHSERREICYLFTHGLLHLFGFDHEDESGKTLMRTAEEAVMKYMGLQRGE